MQDMLRNMSPEQLDAWIAYDALEPIGWRGVWNQLAGVLAIMSAHSGVDSTIAEHLPGLKEDD